MRLPALAMLAIALAPPSAYADDGVGDDHLFAGDGLYRPPLEWSTWIRAAYGAEHPGSPAYVARQVAPAPTTDVHGASDWGFGAEASLPVSAHGDARVGAWGEVRGFEARDAYAGFELVLTRVPRRLDAFFYEGHGILAVRAGRSSTRETAAVAWGYMAPYWLEGPCKVRFYEIETGVCSPRAPRLARMIAGVRLVGTVTRGLDDPREWSATLGLEFEPVGAVRANFAVRSWY
jgi:hypothetical protein